MQACSFWRWCSALAWFGIWITLLRVGVVVPLRIHFCAPSTVVLRSSVLLARIYIFSMIRIKGQLILYMKIEVSIKSKQALYELWTNKENFPFSDSTYPSRNWIIWFQHPDNLTHLRPLLWIWIHTPQSGQQCTFESSRRRPCLYGGINYLLWPPASNHHF